MRPGISDEEVAALCSECPGILLTLDKDFGELIFRRRLPDLSGTLCVVTRDRIRVRPLPPAP